MCGIVSSCLLFLSLTQALSATEYSVTVPFPVRSADWEDTNGLFLAAPQQMMTPDGVGSTEFYLAPVEGTAQVFIAVVFQHSDIPISLTWKSNTTSLEIPLSENLSEGVSGWNQRLLRLPTTLASQGGTVIATGNQRTIARVRMDWLEPIETFAAVDQIPPSLILGGRIIENSQLSGRPELSPADAWFGTVLEAGLQDEPASLDGGILFEVPIEETVGTIILKAKFLGVGLGDAVDVWINDQFIGAMHPVTPSLTDPGYLRTPDQRVIYAGWREGAIFIPSGTLLAGDNQIMLIPPAPGCSVRDAALQLVVPLEPNAPDPVNLTWPEI